MFSFLESHKPQPRHITKISDLTKGEILKVIDLASKMKHSPHTFRHAMQNKTLLMLFEKPSLRTRVSFETGMEEMGGHAIFYDISTSPLGKESFSDFSRVVSRYADFMTARVKNRDDIAQLTNSSLIPVINALDDFAHPMQMLTDLLTIKEKKGKFGMLSDFHFHFPCFFEGLTL